MIGKEIIPINQSGRRKTIRFKQYEWGEIEGIEDWNIAKKGCGPCCIASILATFGYEINPITLCKKLLFSEGKAIDFFGPQKGITGIGMIYLLNQLIGEGYAIEYKIEKINYEHSKEKKEKIFQMIQEGYMAIINVVPSPKSMQVFSKFGHYIVITSVDHENQEFYVANPNQLGDQQIDQTFSYETIIQEMWGRQNGFDFLRTIF